ncbi:MAG TPA: prephenate dehydrogenase/arogenate dehydrogenase family protein [Chloroflexi bacterium]|nr:prephenate dehydrogenase/arogenate dehydrogenase family protein [Chloroflexota bacterium]
MSERTQITLVGLGFVGTSIGLALKARDPSLSITGHEVDPLRARQARRLGAVDRTRINLIRACEQADLVILAIPLLEVRDTLEAIGPELKPGAIVTDTASLKVPVLEWARRWLSPQVHYVGGAPLFNPRLSPLECKGGPEAARADAFEGGLYCITPDTGTTPEAVEQLAALAEMLGARPIFLDPQEHDGLRAAVEALPMLLGTVLLRTALDSPGWREARKVAGPAFLQATAPVVGQARSQAALLRLNRENLLRQLNAWLGTLERLRAMLLAEEEAPLEALFTELVEARDAWMHDRQQGMWEERGREEAPSSGSFLKRLFGFGDRRPPPRSR